MDNTGLGVSGRNKTNTCLKGQNLNEIWGTGCDFLSLSVPWVDFIDWNVQACGDVLNSLVALRDDTHTLSNGLSCDWVITSYHDDLGDGNI